MTKISKTAALAMDVAPLPVSAKTGETMPPAVAKPTAVELVGPIANVLAQVTALSRLGFTVNMDAMPSMFPSTGTAIVVMMPGDPDPTMVSSATRAMSEALAREQFEALNEEKRAALAEKERADQAARSAERAIIEAQIVAQQESLRQLHATLASA